MSFSFDLFTFALMVDAQAGGEVFDVLEMGVVLALTFQLNLYSFSLVVRRVK